MKTQNARQLRFTSFLVFSLVLHGLLAVFLYYAPRLAFLQELTRRLDHTIEDRTEDVVTQIELLNEEEQMKYVVSQSDQSINDQVPDSDEYYLSKNNQTVEKQTRAAHSGRFNNAQAEGFNSRSRPEIQGAQTPPAEQEEQQPMPSTEDVALEAKPKTKVQKLGLTGASFDDTFEKTLQAAQQPSQEGQRGFAGDGVSQTDDVLKDVEIGQQTLLNTREFIYYSYFMRVKDQIRSHWNPQIRHSVQVLFAKDDRSLASVDIKATSVRVTLDQKGYLKKIELLKTSGFKELDLAAIEAFRSAAPFLNPPSGIVEKDGTIRFHWSFILET